MNIEEKKAYLDNGYSLNQISEIEAGLEAGLDISIYDNKDFFSVQMHQIRLGLEQRLPVEQYAKPEYDWFQMEEIRKGMEARLDVSIYAKPELSYEKMRQLREGLVQKINLSEYAHLPAGVLKELRKAMLSNVDIMGFIEQGYDTQQLEAIREALEDGIDVTPYISTEFRGISIREIYRGLKNDLDVSVYAKVDYGWQQMRELRLGMENRIDISKYSSKLYSYRQMYEIRIGLEQGLDIERYSSLMYAADDMRRIRMELQNDRNEKLARVDMKYFEYEGYQIIISTDEMEAYIELTDENASLTKEQILKAVDEAGIIKGIQEAGIERFIERKTGSGPVLIARGYYEKIGKDGWYEYLFRSSVNHTPKISAEGTVEYDNFSSFETIEKGKKIAIYHEAEKGMNGFTVTGSVRRSARGREMSILEGKGIKLLPDKKTYISTLGGKIELEGNHVSIIPFVMYDDLYAANGVVFFDGSVYVRGNIHSGVTIKASGDVIVDGMVEASRIESDGNVILKQGMKGFGMGQITAKKMIVGKCFDSVNIKAEKGILAYQCINCELHTNGLIQISGEEGTIAGGVAYAEKGINAQNIGNSSALFTLLKVGADENILKRQWAIIENMHEIEKEITVFKNAKKEYQSKNASYEVSNKMEEAIMYKQESYEKLRQEHYEMNKRLLNMEQAEIIVKGQLYDGIRVEINGELWNSKKLNKIRIKKYKNQITVFSI